MTALHDARIGIVGVGLIVPTVLALLLPTVAVAQTIDSDGDGVADPADAFPCDPMGDGEAFLPAQGQFGYYVFEDQWQYKGDNDFNDVVMAYNYDFKHHHGEFFSIRATFDPIALGGSFNNGFGFHFAGIPRQRVSSATVRVGNGPALAIQGMTSESEFTVILSDNLRNLFGGQGNQINSIPSQPSAAAQAVQIDMVFDPPLDVLNDFGFLLVPSAPGVATTYGVDPFIFRSSDPSHEIHFPGFGGTSRMNTSLFGTGDDQSAPGRFFVDDRNLQFALEFPQPIPYPVEGTPISTLYPRILSFAASSGSQDADFYTTPVVAHAYSNPPAPAFPGGEQSYPVDRSCIMPPAAMPISKVAVGILHSCAASTSGSLRCWGHGGGGRLGYGSTVNIGDDETIASVGDVDVGGPVVDVVAGYHTCALLATGAVRCWGGAYRGQLGYGNRTAIGDDETPASAGDVDIGGTVVQLAAGVNHTCALLATGGVRCWGSGFAGQLGYANTNTIGDDETPASAGDVDVGGTVIQIAAGGSQTCAILLGGNLRCWGNNFGGALGYGHMSKIGDNETPASAGDVNVGGSVIDVSVGNSNTCAVLATGGVRCWGNNPLGELGYGNLNRIGDDEFPADAGDINLGGVATQVSISGNHACARLSNGAVRCWGDGAYGQLGYANSTSIGDDESPATAGDVSVGASAVEVVAGSRKSCARLTSGHIRCWGDGFQGRLGYGNNTIIGDDEFPSSAGNVPVF